MPEYPYINKDGDLIQGPEDEIRASGLDSDTVEALNDLVNSIGREIIDFTQRFEGTPNEVMAAVFAKLFVTGIVLIAHQRPEDERQEFVDDSVEMIRKSLEFSVGALNDPDHPANQLGLGYGQRLSDDDNNDE